MADKNIPNVFSPNTGIEQILWREDIQDAKLPQDKGALTPSDDFLDVKLGKVFDAPSLDSYILDHLRPSLRDKALLIPARYQAALQEVHHELQRMSNENVDSGDGEVVRDAAALLQGEEVLMGLLNTYRNLLHRA